MSHSEEFYSARAAEASKEAAEAELDNVRDRALRAEATWLGLAAQAKKVELTRGKSRREREEKGRIF